MNGRIEVSYIGFFLSSFHSVHNFFFHTRRTCIRSLNQLSQSSVDKYVQWNTEIHVFYDISLYIWTACRLWGPTLTMIPVYYWYKFQTSSLIYFIYVVYRDAKFVTGQLLHVDVIIGTDIVNKWHILGVNFSAPEPIPGDKLVHFLGTPGTVGIRRRLGSGPFLTVNPM